MATFFVCLSLLGKIFQTGILERGKTRDVFIFVSVSFTLRSAWGGWALNLHNLHVPMT
jgi:hypothetical protein